MNTTTEAIIDVRGRLDQMMTKHASNRMETRGLTNDAVAAAITYGRIVHVRGADIYAIGRKEVDRLREDGLDLSRFEGVQVVVSPDGAVLTTYRNSDFSSLKPHRSWFKFRRRSPRTLH